MNGVQFSLLSNSASFVAKELSNSKISRRLIAFQQRTSYSFSGLCFIHKTLTFDRPPSFRPAHLTIAAHRIVIVRMKRLTNNDKDKRCSSVRVEQELTRQRINDNQKREFFSSTDIGPKKEKAHIHS
ncbi:hypothetical protein L6452_37341 [Arctium lappa]|uniref:Uncharacterized protein n=1 Tax=Arctium lappa TaxID=4217 RepID=A0ACB8Y2P9_ARCLA|nr:hypothetical protein L6452_37341 [Arctium lappa]